MGLKFDICSNYEERESRIKKLTRWKKTRVDRSRVLTILQPINRWMTSGYERRYSFFFFSKEKWDYFPSKRFKMAGLLNTICFSRNDACWRRKERERRSNETEKETTTRTREEMRMEINILYAMIAYRSSIILNGNEKLRW